MKKGGKTQFDREKARNNLAGIYNKLKDIDITLLHEYHKLYKKEISFFRRAETAAWLFMYYDRRETPQLSNAGNTGAQACGPKVREQRIKSEKKSASAAVTGNTEISQQSSCAGQERPQSTCPDDVSIPDEESKKLFISIGKNRRLYPKEIITLIMSKTDVPREDIGVIRILDNYSFVQVRDTKADAIIEALKGLRFRGRTLMVNYAKPKTGDNCSE